jgi:Putative zinc-finger
MIHLTAEQLSTCLDGELGGTSEQLVRDHLAACEACSVLLRDLAGQDETLSTTLRSDPDDAFFDRITRTLEQTTRPVSQALPPGQLLPSQTVRPGSGSFPWGAALIIGTIACSIGTLQLGAEFVPRWLSESGRGERLLRAASGDVPGLDGGSTEPETPSAQTPEEAANVAAPAANVADIPAPAPAPATVAAPVLAAPAVPAPAAPAPVPAEQPKRAAGPRPGAILPWESVAPPPRVSAAEVLPGAPEDSPEDSKDAAPDSFMLVAPGAVGAVRLAQQRDEEAELHPSVYAYEVAAAAWERTLGLLHGDAYREARFRLAESRYLAWKIAPSGERAEEVSATVRAYLVSAPPGPDRGKASDWLLDVEGNRFR